MAVASRNGPNRMFAKNGFFILILLNTGILFKFNTKQLHHKSSLRAKFQIKIP